MPNRTDFRVVSETGFREAIIGLKLSYLSKQDTDFSEYEITAKDYDLAVRLSKAKEGSHKKFLRAIAVTIDATLPLYVWKQLDQYKVGLVTSSTSTMHTIMKKHLTQSDFFRDIPARWLLELNTLIDAKDFQSVIELLPSSFLQRRYIYTNYQTLQTILKDRQHHKLAVWHYICSEIVKQATYKELLNSCT